MSIRLRLSLLYTAILVLVLLAFSLVLYTMQSRSLLGSVEQSVVLGAQRAAVGHLRDLSSGQPPAPPPPPDEARPVPALYVQQLRDANGGIIESMEGDSESDIVLPLSPSALQAAQLGKLQLEIIRVSGQRYMVCSMPVMLGGELTEIVQIGRSLEEPDQLLGALRSGLLAGIGLATFVAFGLGWVLAGLALRPIDRITQTAQAIGSERDFQRRVEYVGPRDEVGRLATTFNAMLAELQTAHQQVEESLQRLRSFVADVSHELRTPLTTIRGNLSLLNERPLAREEQHEILADTVGETDRLIRLVTDLLTLARAEARRRLHVEPVPLTPLVQDACRKARLLDPDRTVHCDPVPSATALGDRDGLEQALLALLDNALKHGEGTITVSIRSCLAPGADAQDAFVAIDVQDEGPGIDPNALPHLFERFTRGERAEDTPGLGLGLPIAKALMEAQQGALTVASELGQGSVFTLLVPRADSPGPESA